MPSEPAAEASDPDVVTILGRQSIELQARRLKLQAEQEVFRKEISGFQESIIGYLAQIKSTEQRLSLFGEELRDKAVLFERQLARKADLLSLQRAEASLSGELGELMGRVADARERIARADQQIASLRSTALQKAVEELRETETELDDVEEQIRAARDVVDRTEVIAPVRGAVVKINHHTHGGVIGPGVVIMELLPVNEELLIEARISPSEISHVQEGQRALVRLNALNQRLIPMIAAEVAFLSPDSIAEADARQSGAGSAGNSFLVRVRLDPEDIKEKAGKFEPLPGMPADIFIRTGERTFFDYLMQSVFDSFSRAFREN